jgi:DNA-binding CsgD family transcriptional regulator
MKCLKPPRPGPGAKKNFLVHPETFIFFDKGSGARRFAVNAQADGSLPVDEVLSMLVVQCVLRGQRPEDLTLAMTSSEDFLNGIRERARKLIATCRFTGTVELTGRQQEVVRGVLEDLSNKELGNKLNVSARTVKFHVTSLLQKFQVPNRISLKRRVAEMVSAGQLTVSDLIKAGAEDLIPKLAVRRERAPVGLDASERRLRGLAPVLALEEKGTRLPVSGKAGSARD